MSLSCRPAVRLLIRPHGNHVLLTNDLFTCHPNIPSSSSFFSVCISGLQLSTPLGLSSLAPPHPRPAERLHSLIGPPPSRPAVALTGRDCWRSPDRSLASGRQPAPTRSLHEGQSDTGGWPSDAGETLCMLTVQPIDAQSLGEIAAGCISVCLSLIWVKQQL